MARYSEEAILLDPALVMSIAGTPADDWQAKILRHRADRLILNCSRQAGKSKIVAASIVEQVIREQTLVLVVCPAERQAKLMVKSVSDIYEHIRPLKQPQSTTHLEFPNGSEMWALPCAEGNIRGFSGVGYLVLDEASRIPDSLYYAVRPMIAISGGRIACLSTPFGKRGFFHEEWTKGEGWERVKITCDECPRITAKFIAEEKRSLPRNWFLQEYMCEFMETEGAVFAFDDIESALNSDALPLFGADTFSSTERPLFS